MAKRERWWWSTPKTYLGALADALLAFVAILLTAAVIDDDGWRGGLVIGAGFAGVRLLISTFQVWNDREPDAA